MAALSDAVVIGTVLVLIFGAASYYLYSRISQLDYKLGLMESILLNLKMAMESTLLSSVRDDPPMKLSPTQPPMESSQRPEHFREQMDTQEQGQGQEQEDYQKILDDAHNAADVKDVNVSEQKAPQPQTPTVHVVKDAEGNSKMHIGFESMSWKELCAEAKKRNIAGTSHLNRRKLIDILNKREGINTETSSQAPAEVSPLSAWNTDDIGSELLTTPDE
jgi:hypothetical protein